MPRTISAPRLHTLLGSSLDRSPAYLALADGIRLLISDGRIVAGTRLPSERELTTALGLSRTTVTRAYAVLRERGYVVSRQGSGSVVSLPVQQGGSHDPLLSPEDIPPGSIDLTCAASSAPPGVAAAYEAAVERLPSFLTGAGYFPSGVPALKEVIARRYTERGLDTTPDQVVVTCGALAATAVVVRALTAVGDRVLVESPSYPNALGTITRSGARTVGAGVDPTGWDLETWESTIRSVRPAAAYLVPDFQNPTGRLMPEDQRERLAATLRSSRTVPVVDETLVEMSLDPVDMPRPFAAFAEETITVGSAAKAFWGGLRIGWIRAPGDRVGALVGSRLTLDLGAPPLEQLVLTELMAANGAVLEHHRDQLRASRETLVEALTRRLPDWRFHTPAGGLALWCELPSPLSSALSTAAEEQGLLLPAGPSFAPEGGLERFVRIPYTQRPEVLADAVERLVPAWSDAQGSRRPLRRRSPLVA
jgi:DNA-binding transcriptional MocR family regulator